MRVVEVRANRSILVGLLGDVREWLDQNGGMSARLNVERASSVGIVTAQINNDDLAERFCKAFRGSYID
jgi:hypothetical protein